MNTKILFTLIMFMGLIACQQEESPQSNELSFDSEQSNLLFEQDLLDYENYVKKNGEVTVEVITLEDLQKFVEEHNLSEISQEIIDDYHFGKKFKATGACNSGWINYCGDLTHNGVFSTADLHRYNLLCNTVCSSSCTPGGGCSSWPLPSYQRRFGYLSWYRNGGGKTWWSRDDYNAAYLMILGVFSC